MKVGIDSYCYHRYFGEIYPDQSDPGTRWTFQDFVRRAAELEVDGVSLESCFFESLEPAYLESASSPSWTSGRWNECWHGATRTVWRLGGTSRPGRK